MITILLIILIVMFLGSFPVYSYNTTWGYGPPSILGFVLMLFLIYILFGAGHATVPR